MHRPSPRACTVRRASLAGLLLCLLPLASCASLTAPAGSVEVSVDHEGIETRRHSGTLFVDVPVTVVNGSNRTVHISTCSTVTNPLVVLEKHVDGEWRPGIGMICALIVTPPVPLRPGQTLHHTAQLSIFLESATPPEIPGTYRAVLGIFRDRDHRGILAEAERTSDAFTLSE